MDLLWIFMLNHSHTRIAIYWDYENVPLHRNDAQEFVKGLKSFVESHDIACFKIFHRPGQLSDADEGLLAPLPGIQFKCVNRCGKNAVDSILIQSCKDFLTAHPEVGHLVLIAGDRDFLVLTKEKNFKNTTLSLVCQKANCSRQLSKSADFYTFIDEIARLPDDWWLSNIHFPDPYEWDKEDKLMDAGLLIEDGDWDFGGYDLSSKPFDDDEDEIEECWNEKPDDEENWGDE